MTFTRITVNPNQMGGVRCMRGLRIAVATVVGLVAEGQANGKSSTRTPTSLLTTFAKRSSAPPLQHANEYFRPRWGSEFLIDNALSPQVAPLLRDAGHDAVHVRE